MKDQEKSRAQRDLLMGVGGFLLFVLLSLGLLTALNPASASYIQSRGLRSPFGGKTVDITLIHTNDIWGYVDPCG